MDAVDIPVRFNIPFAADAGGSYIRPVPEASQIGVTPGAASLTDGFPPLNFTPRSAGGVPPFGEDMNGILNQITAWLQWAQAGGAVVYNSAFAAAIGGYPQGALLSSTTAGNFWQSTVDANVTDPDGVSAAGWISVGSGQIQAQSGNYAVDTGTANNYVVALSPAIPSYTGGLVIRWKPLNTNTGASVINVNGKGNKPVVYADGSALQPGAIPAAGFSEGVYQPTLDKVILTSFTPPVMSGNSTAGTVAIPGTPYKIKWQTVSVAQPGSGSDVFAGGYNQTNVWSWDTAFSTICIAAFASYPVVANGQCTFGVAQTSGPSGGTLWTTAAQNLRPIGNTVIIGFGI